jgi:hypothetical protein
MVQGSAAGVAVAVAHCSGAAGRVDTHIDAHIDAV